MLTKKVTFWGKSTANFTVYLLLFEDHICPFPKKLASHNSMQIRKTIMWANKTANKEEGLRKKRQRDGKIETDSQKRQK